MTIVDLDRLERDAHMLSVHDNPVVQRMARNVLICLATPTMFVPDGMALVKRPELLGLGVPGRG